MLLLRRHGQSEQDLFVWFVVNVSICHGSSSLEIELFSRRRRMKRSMLSSSITAGRLCQSFSAAATCCSHPKRWCQRWPTNSVNRNHHHHHRTTTTSAPPSPAFASFAAAAAAAGDRPTLRQRLWQSYCHALQERPLVTKASMAALIFFLSDSATKRKEYHRHRHYHDDDWYCRPSGCLHQHHRANIAVDVDVAVDARCIAWRNH